MYCSHCYTVRILRRNRLLRDPWNTCSRDCKGRASRVPAAKGVLRLIDARVRKGSKGHRRYVRVLCTRCSTERLIEKSSYIASEPSDFCRVCKGRPVEHGHIIQVSTLAAEVGLSQSRTEVLLRRYAYSVEKVREHRQHEMSRHLPADEVNGWRLVHVQEKPRQYTWACPHCNNRVISPACYMKTSRCRCTLTRAPRLNGYPMSWSDWEKVTGVPAGILHRRHNKLGQHPLQVVQMPLRIHKRTAV